MYKLLVGLGNPGKKYQNTRHNLGRILVEKYAQQSFVEFKVNKQFQASIGESRVGESKIILALPTTYMNLSGQSVAKISNFYKIDPQNIFIAHDDLDSGVGESKIQFDRGPSGHNGIKSTIDHLGTQAFWRLRIGIGHPIDNIPVEDYVLLPPSKEEKAKIDQEIDRIIKILETTLTSS